MASYHMCSDDCFSGRTASKFKIICMYCDCVCNSKCYDIISLPFLKLLSSDSNAFFLCIKCHDKITKLKIKEKDNNRKSRNSLTSLKHVTVPSTDNQTKPLPDKVSGANSLNQNASYDDLMNLINKKFENLESISKDINQKINSNQSNSSNSNLTQNETSIKNSDEKIIQLAENIISLHAKLDSYAGRIERHTRDDSSSDIIVSKLDELSNKIYNKPPRNSINNPSKLKRFNDKLTNTNPLDWSLQFNQSLDVIQNFDSSDLYPLLASFEQNTWASFDFLKQKIDESIKIMTNMELHCKSVTEPLNGNGNIDPEPSIPASPSSLLLSPLIRSIELEKIDDILNKCEKIEHEINCIFSHQTRYSSGESYKDNSNSMENHLAISSQLNSENLAMNAMASLETSCDIASVTVDNNPESPTNFISNDSTSIFIDSFNDISCDNILGNIIPSESESQRNIAESNTNHKKMELYLSNLPPELTDSDILNYIKKKLDYNPKDITLHRLVKRGMDISQLSFISFKIDTIESIGHALSNANFWPNKCTIKEFVKKTNSPNRNHIKNMTAITNNFLAATQTTTQTT